MMLVDVFKLPKIRLEPLQLGSQRSQLSPDVSTLTRMVRKNMAANLDRLPSAVFRSPYLSPADTSPQNSASLC